MSDDQLDLSLESVDDKKPPKKARPIVDFIDTYLEFTKDHESTEKIHKWTAISMIAALLERRTWLDRGYYTLFPNLFIFIVARSGIVKKSTSTGIGVSMLRDIQGFKIMSERLTAASLITQMKDSLKSFEFGYNKVKQSPVFAYASELAVFMGEVYGSIIELLTTFYDGVPYDSEKPWTYKRAHEDPDLVYGPCLNILGATTKPWLHKVLPKSEQEGGFTSRCIWVVEDQLPRKLVPWPEINDHNNALKMILMEDMERIFSLRGKFYVDPKAKETFAEWYEYHMKNVAYPNKDPRLTGYFARKGDLILKLAMVKSVSKGSALRISESHIEWAGKQLEDLERDMIMAFEPEEDDLPEADIVTPYDIVQYVRSKSSATIDEIKERFPIFKNECEEIIEELKDMGKLLERENDSGRKLLYVSTL